VGLIFGRKLMSFSHNNCWFFNSGLGTTLYSQELRKDMTIITIYDPYADVIAHLERIFIWGWLGQGNIFIEVDINFSLCSLEV
jgi:hypothetical protein